MRRSEMRTIRRGTTPTLYIAMPYTADKIADGYVTFMQRDVIVLDKRLSDKNVRVEDRRITVKLAQSETLRFSAGSRGEIQLRLLLDDGNAPASSVGEFFVGKVLRDGVITGAEASIDAEDIFEFGMDFDAVVEVSSGGTTDHSKLNGRDAADQHPISAITGLEKALSGKVDGVMVATDEEIAEMLKGIFGSEETTQTI